MAERWIYLPSENVFREFPSRLFLALCAVERGYVVCIGKKQSVGLMELHGPPGFVLDKGMASWRLDQFKKRLSLGHRIGVSEEESLIIYQLPKNFLEQRSSPEILNTLDFYFTWGKEQSRLMQEA